MIGTTGVEEGRRWLRWCRESVDASGDGRIRE
jgi:hypothetical protein